MRKKIKCVNSYWRSTFSFQLRKNKILSCCKPTGMRENERIYVGNKSRRVLELGGQRETKLRLKGQMNWYNKKNTANIYVHTLKCLSFPVTAPSTPSALLVAFVLGVSSGSNEGLWCLVHISPFLPWFQFCDADCMSFSFQLLYGPQKHLNFSLWFLTAWSAAPGHNQTLYALPSSQEAGHMFLNF